MGDEVDRAVALLCKRGDRRVDVFRKLLERLLAAGVVEIERGEAVTLQRSIHFLQRPGTDPDAVKQDHAVAPRIRRCDGRGLDLTQPRAPARTPAHGPSSLP